MILPAGINATWLTSKIIPARELDEARRLHDLELFNKSIEILDGLLDHRASLIAENNYTGMDAIVLYGWNLLFLKDHVRLDDLIAGLQEFEFTVTPELEVLRAWSKLNRGIFNEVLEDCRNFISANKSPILPIVSDFLFLQSYAEAKLGLIAESLVNAEISHSLFKLRNENRGAGWVGNFLGIIHRRLAQYPEALKWFHRTLPYYEDLKLDRKRSMVHLNIGVTYYKLGNYAKSLENLSLSHRLGEAGGWVHRQCFANIALGNVYRLTRDFESARRHLHTAYNQAQEIQSPREEALALEFLGDVYRDQCQYVEARRFYSRSLAIGRKIAPDGDIVMEVHRRIGECHTFEHNTALATPELQHALAMARSQGDRYEEGVTLRILAEACRSVGDLKRARRLIDQSVNILQEIGARHEWAVSLMNSVDLAIQEAEHRGHDPARQDELQKAWSLATRALDLFLAVGVSWWTEQSRSQVSRIANMRAAQATSIRGSTVAGPSPSHQSPDLVVHVSRVMRDTLQLCDMFAGSTEPVLIYGETGTGKELIARRIHRQSERRDGHLVAVNVAAIPQTMFEREFFGHVKGAFSGAERDLEGFAARADGGTLFLDEIGDLPLEAQPKLLRLIQEGTYQAIGDPTERRSSVRLVAATNADLGRLVQEGRFRADLYYRLKILELEIPPVRERKEDVLPLMRHFLCDASSRPEELSAFFNRESQQAILDYDWPGNVREIMMVARRAQVDLKSRGRVEVKIARGDNGPVVFCGPEKETYDRELEKTPEFDSRDAAERSRILMALEANGDSRIHAAKSLGIGRSTLYRRMVKLGIPRRRP